MTDAKLDHADFFEVTEADRAEMEKGYQRSKVPPCLECGAINPEDAETKCRAGGDKDHCHGCTLWL